MDELKNYVSVPEAARIAAVARNTMRLAAKNGHIRAIKPGRNWLIDTTDIARWKSEHYQSNMARSGETETDTLPEDSDT